jgi:hypothetical protein
VRVVPCGSELGGRSKYTVEVMLDVVVVIAAVVGTKEAAVRLMVGSLTDQKTSMEEEV